MSVGPLREGHDKSKSYWRPENICSAEGGPCRILDIIICERIALKAKSDPTMCDFLFQLLVSYFEQKYKLKLNPRIFLPFSSYWLLLAQSTPSQRWNTRENLLSTKEWREKKPQKFNSLIPRISSKRKISKNSFLSTSLISLPILPSHIFSFSLLILLLPRSIQTPQFKIFLGYGLTLDEYSGAIRLSELSNILFEIHLPLLVHFLSLPSLSSKFFASTKFFVSTKLFADCAKVTGKHIYLEISKNELYLRSGNLYELICKTPVPVVSSQAKAWFSTSQRKLRVELEVFFSFISRYRIFPLFHQFRSAFSIKGRRPLQYRRRARNWKCPASRCKIHYWMTLSKRSVYLYLNFR